MKKAVIIFFLITFVLMIPLIYAAGGGGGNGGGDSGGSAGASSGGGSGGTPFSSVTCLDDGSISFYMAKKQKIIAYSQKKNKAMEVQGEWDQLGNFKSKEVIFNDPDTYNITNDQGITRVFTCPGFKFACSIVSLYNTRCIKNQSGIFAEFDFINDTEIQNLKFNFGSGQRIFSYEKGVYSPELKNLSIEKRGNKIILKIPLLDLQTFEVVHKKCIGKRYIYSRTDCSALANTTGIDPNILKCGGLLDLKDRVRCRINLESEEEEYQNFYPEECRTHKNPIACVNLYKRVSDCWDIIRSRERIDCLKEKIELAQAQDQEQKNERLIALIKLRFYNLEEQAEILQEHELLEVESLIEFVTQVELKKRAINQAKTKNEIRRIIQEVRDLWTELMKNMKNEK